MNQILLSVADVAELLAVREGHVRRLVFDRRIPYLKVGRLVRFDRREIDEWLAEMRRPVVEDVLDLAADRRTTTPPRGRRAS